MLIVEDNSFERESLRGCINWELVGVGRIHTASNGIEGLKAMKSQSPDVVLTDIKMPRMDGLEMLDRASEQGMRPKFVFCSAFEDFTYVQQAMRKGAANYLLKPVNQRELIQTIREIINIIIDEKLVEAERKRYRDEQKAYLSKIRTNYIKEMVLQEQQKTPGSAYLPMSDVYLKMHAGYSVASIEVFHQSNGIFDKHNSNELILRNLSENPLLGNADFFYNDVGILIALNHSIQSQSDLQTLAFTIRDVLETLSGGRKFQFFIGVSGISMDITDVNRLYNQACAMLEKRILLGYGRVEFYCDSIPKQTLACPDQDDIRTAVQNTVSKIMSGEELETSFDTLEKVLAQYYANNIQGIQSVLVKLVSDLLSHSYNRHPANAAPDYEIYQNVIGARSMPGAIAYVKQFCEDIRDRMATNSKNKTDKLIEQIMNILQTEYSENITLNYLSKKVYLSANYIRLIFKEKTNRSILECLVGIRMAKAKELLVSSDLTVGDISGMVGYANTSYFCTAFKSETGLSPSEFRRVGKRE